MRISCFRSECKYKSMYKGMYASRSINQSIIYSSVDNIGHISRASSYYVSLTPCAHGCRDILHRRTLSSCSSSLCLVLGDICVWFGNKTKIRKMIIPKSSLFEVLQKFQKLAGGEGGERRQLLWGEAQHRGHPYFLPYMRTKISYHHRVLF